MADIEMVFTGDGPNKGRRARFAEGRANAAMRQGFQPVPQPKQDEPWTPTESALMGGARFLSLGQDDTAAGVGAGLGAGVQALLDGRGLSEAADEAGGAYTEGRDEQRKRAEQAYKENPWAYRAGAALGTGATVGAGAAGLAAKGATALTRAAANPLVQAGVGGAGLMDSDTAQGNVGGVVVGVGGGKVLGKVIEPVAASLARGVPDVVKRGAGHVWDYLKTPVSDVPEATKNAVASVFKRSPKTQARMDAIAPTVGELAQATPLGKAQRVFAENTDRAAAARSMQEQLAALEAAEALPAAATQGPRALLPSPRAQPPAPRAASPEPVELPPIPRDPDAVAAEAARPFTSALSPAKASSDLSPAMAQGLAGPDAYALEGQARYLAARAAAEKMPVDELAALIQSSRLSSGLGEAATGRRIGLTKTKMSEIGGPRPPAADEHLLAVAKQRLQANPAPNEDALVRTLGLGQKEAKQLLDLDPEARALLLRQVQ